MYPSPLWWFRTMRFSSTKNLYLLLNSAFLSIHGKTSWYLLKSLCAVAIVVSWYRRFWASSKNWKVLTFHFETQFKKKLTLNSSFKTRLVLSLWISFMILGNLLMQCSLKYNFFVKYLFSIFGIFNFWMIILFLNSLKITLIFSSFMKS